MSARASSEALSNNELDVAMKDQGGSLASALVRASPSLIHDISALWFFMISSATAPEVSIRSKSIVTVVYGFGDAPGGSGLGFDVHLQKRVQLSNRGLGI